MIAKPTEEQVRRDKIAAGQIRWQNDQRKKEHRRALEEKKEKERRRDHGRGRDYDRDRMRELERERERERDIEEGIRMREIEAAMQDYKPEVNLEYTDNKGRILKTAEVKSSNTYTGFLSYSNLIYIGFPIHVASIPW